MERRLLLTSLSRKLTVMLEDFFALFQCNSTCQALAASYCFASQILGIALAISRAFPDIVLFRNTINTCGHMMICCSLEHQMTGEVRHCCRTLEMCAHSMNMCTSSTNKCLMRMVCIGVENNIMREVGLWLCGTMWSTIRNHILLGGDPSNGSSRFQC